MRWLLADAPFIILLGIINSAFLKIIIIKGYFLNSLDSFIIQCRYLEVQHSAVGFVY